MIRPSRREVLLGACALACAPRKAPAPPLPDRVRLGWRLVPGQQLTYQTDLVRQAPGRTTTRRERWTYLVTDRERGVCSLRGQLVGLGADSEPTTAPTGVQARLADQRREGDAVDLRLGSDGRLRPLAGLGCRAVGAADPDCFGRHLPHRLLALPLPDAPVGPGDTWEDPGLALPFRPLLPEELEVDADGVCAVSELYQDDTIGPCIDLLSTLLLRTDGPTLRADGRSTWDLARGTLARRSLRIRVAGLGPAVGALDLTLTRSPLD